AGSRQAGALVAQGLTPEQAVAEIGQTVEGLTTAPILRDLSHRLGVELPVTEGVCAVLSGQSITELAAGLMGREPTQEERARWLACRARQLAPSPSPPSPSPRGIRA